MTELDDELRAALRGLAGDPEADAAAVRARLAWERRRRRPRWVLPLATAAAGVLVGWLLHPVPPPPAAAPTESERPAVEPPRPLATVVAAEGLRLGGTDAGVLAPVMRGVVLDTSPGGYAELATPDGILLRLGPETELALSEPTAAALSVGRLWLRAQDRGWTVMQEQGRVVTEPQSEIDVFADRESLVLTVLSGEAELIADDGIRRRLRPMQRIAIRDGLVGDRERVYWRSEVLAWQADILCGPRHLEELGKLVAGPLDELAFPSMRPMASAVLREIGHCSVPFLLEFLRSEKGEPATRAAAAGLVGDLADMGSAPSLLALLGDDDAEVRVAAFRGLSRASGVSRGDEEFWRRSSPELRARMISAWQQALTSDR